MQRRRLGLIAILGAGALAGCTLPPPRPPPPYETGSASAPSADAPAPPPLCDRAPDAPRCKGAQLAGQ